MKVIKLVVLVLSVFAFTNANAQGKKGNPEKRFAKIDADGSGSFDLTEFTAYTEAVAAKRAEKAAERAANGETTKPKKERKPKDPSKAFGKMDTDANGSVDLAEYQAFIAMKKEKKAKRKGRKARQNDGE